MKHVFLPALLCSLFPCLLLADTGQPADSVRFICGELLGRPTANSVTVNLCVDRDIDAYIEYGTQKGGYPSQMPASAWKGSVPFNVVIQNLLPSTAYYYRVRYRAAGAPDFAARAERSFRTARPKGEAFTFAIEADPHLDSNTDTTLYRLTLKNIARNNPDFLIDLGDTFMSEKLQKKTQDSILARHLLLRSYFDSICHSIPLYLVIGNHEGELGWLLDGTTGNLAVMASNTRTQYYPNPLPDAFYTGNSKSEAYVGLRQNYYAWEWGSALFVVLDPYWYTATKPNQNVDNWSWTLGSEQYLWFTQVLETSTAKFKFVFCHQVVGGNSTDGRGGAEAVPFYEMGGHNIDSSWGYASHRQGWELPLHQLMVKNRVNVFFHGHDHFYDRQELDGVVYQEVPQPGNPNYKTAGNAANYGYVTGKIIPCAGFLKVTVSDSAAVVDYVRAYLPATESPARVNGAVDFSYTLRPGATSGTADGAAFPAAIDLGQNFPNPVHSVTTIRYRLSETGFITLKVYDALGKEAAALVDARYDAGEHTAEWKPGGLPAGMYHYRLTTERGAVTRALFYVR